MIIFRTFTPNSPRPRILLHESDIYFCWILQRFAYGFDSNTYLIFSRFFLVLFTYVLTRLLFCCAFLFCFLFIFLELVFVMGELDCRARAACWFEDFLKLRSDCSFYSSCLSHRTPNLELHLLHNRKSLKRSPTLYDP